jgi:hypothetical protein
MGRFRPSAATRSFRWTAASRERPEQRLGHRGLVPPRRILRKLLHQILTQIVTGKGGAYPSDGPRPWPLPFWRFLSRVWHIWQLMITWNPRSVSAGAQIEISDGVERSVIPLWPGQSSATYGVRNGDVEVSLTSNRGNYESARFLTRPVGLRPSVEVQATRAEVAQLESQLQQLRRTAEQGRARIKNLDRLIGRLTPH